MVYALDLCVIIFIEKNKILKKRTEMKSKICLIRHGITEGNKNRLYYGYADIPLAPEGIEELKKLKAEGIYPDDENASYYTTGLKRTEQTFSIIYGEQDHSRIDVLREINFGDYEMKSHDDLKISESYRSWVSDDTGKMAPPNGESIERFVERINKGFEALKKEHFLKELSMRHSGKEAMSIVVCHGGSISAILESIYPGDNESFYRWIPDPGHGYILTLENGVFTDREKF